MKRLRQVLVALAAILVIAGLGTGAWTTDATNRAEREWPAQGRFVTVRGVRLHFVERGLGPAIVLLHGNPGSTRDWPPALLDSLARGRRVLAFDRPGHGHSGRPDADAMTPARQALLLRDAFLKVGVERPVVVGHSWGGALALTLATEHPAAVSGLVVVGTRAYPRDDSDPFLYRLVRTPVVGTLFRRTLLLPAGRGPVAEGVAAAFAPDSVRTELASAARDLWLRPSQAAALAWDTRLLREALPAQAAKYPRLRVPLAVVVGDADHPDRESAPLARAVPGATLAVLPHTGHYAQWTQPQAVLAAVRAVETRAGRSPACTEGERAARQEGEGRAGTRGSDDADPRGCGRLPGRPGGQGHPDRARPGDGA